MSHAIAYASAVHDDGHCLVHSTVYGAFKFDGAEIFERGAELSKSQCAESQDTAIGNKSQYAGSQNTAICIKRQCAGEMLFCKF